MNSEAIAKIIKVVIIVAGLAGYNIDPEQINIIVEGGSAAYAVISGIEAWIKNKKVSP